MKNKSAIVIGWINTGRPADCGETMKNQLMIQKLEELGVHCYQVDFKNWKKHPWVFLYLAWCMVAHHGATLIFSSSCCNVYPMMKLMKLVGWKQNSIHWVIGGDLHEYIKKGIYAPSVLNCCNYTLVESKQMVNDLTNDGLCNVVDVPNFKPVFFLPDISKRFNSKRDEIRFVYLSRIIPEKGCVNIAEAAKLLNENHKDANFVVDFYGKIEEDFEEEFLGSIKNLPNVNYKGFLDLRENEGYEKLASYDVMLFPTYWPGEGFAGIFMDAFIAGLPIIATDWGHNTEFLKDGYTSIVIPPKDSKALAKAMYQCVCKKDMLQVMSKNCQSESSKYNVDNVVTKELIEKINI